MRDRKIYILILLLWRKKYEKTEGPHEEIYTYWFGKKKNGRSSFYDFFLFLHHERHKEYSIIYVFPIILYFPIKKNNYVFSQIIFYLPYWLQCEDWHNSVGPRTSTVSASASPPLVSPIHFRLRQLVFTGFSPLLHSLPDRQTPHPKFLGFQGWLTWVVRPQTP